MKRTEKQAAEAWTETRVRDGVPDVCKSCDNYLPMFFKVMDKECAVFATCDGVKNNACGAWSKRIPPPVF